MLVRAILGDIMLRLLTLSFAVSMLFFPFTGFAENRLPPEERADLKAQAKTTWNTLPADQQQNIKKKARSRHRKLTLEQKQNGRERLQHRRFRNAE